MFQYKNIDFDDKLSGLIRHMNAVEEYREALQNLQGVWDNLTLLGQLTGVGTDMTTTRQSFNKLTSSLLNQLGSKNLEKCVMEIGSKAQVAIDILVRNLYERTADIGFLATDEDIREFLRHQQKAKGAAARKNDVGALKEKLLARFAEYVAKYSVYSDIVLLDTDGKILVRLDDQVDAECCTDTLVKESLETHAAYVETYGELAMMPKNTRSLVYSYRVTDHDGTALGVLCLCFRFENEMAGIFSNLTMPDDWSVITLLDDQGRVISSSDNFHIPVGAHLEQIKDADYRIVRFGPLEYIAVTRSTQGYQGYMGPGWTGHVMLPVQHAFNKDDSEMLYGLSRDVLDAVMKSPALFGSALRAIPSQAEHIQNDLNRSVWNGNVRQTGEGRAINPSFSKVLLWEISNTGKKTKDVFERSIENLHQTVVSSILQDSQFQAALAIDIMDRNLYERANDCRWWALTSAFRALLSAPKLSAESEAQMSAILEYINGLYTVYSNLIVFDASGKIVSVSNTDERNLIGRQIDEEWHQRVLGLPDSQGYAVSEFKDTVFYGGKHTYIYGAAIFAPDNQTVVGGVGIVFDSSPQFRAMLCDALPRDGSGNIQAGSFGIFVGQDGTVIACSDHSYSPGDKFPIAREQIAFEPGSSVATILELAGNYYAVGIRASSGYREYKSSQDRYHNEVAAVILVPLGETSISTQPQKIAQPKVISDVGQGADGVEIATFLIGQNWYGVRSKQVVEAVDASGLTAVPGAGQDLAGYVFYDGLPRPVFQVKHLLEDEEETEVSQSAQIIMLRRDSVTLFGLLVNDLGDIPEVKASRLADFPEALAGGCVLAESILAVDDAGSEKMLIVLGIERLYKRLSTSVKEPLLKVHAANKLAESAALATEEN